MMAADVLLGDDQRWHGLNYNGTASFFENGRPRMLVLSRLELNDAVASCCSMDITVGTCHDAYVFRSPLDSGVKLELFDFQQNVWQAENYAIGLLRHGGYELYNPCFSLPLFHNHVSDQRPNQNQNRFSSCTSRTPLHNAASDLHSQLTLPLPLSILFFRENTRRYNSCCLPQLNLTAQCLDCLKKVWK